MSTIANASRTLSEKGAKSGSKPVVGGRRGLNAADALAIARRLRKLKKEEEWGTYAELAQKTKIAEATLKSWMNLNVPTAPDPFSLLKLARKMNLSLDWLLLGTGTPFRDGLLSSPDVKDQLKMHLRRRCGVTSVTGANIDVNVDEILQMAEDSVSSGVQSLRASLNFFADLVVARGSRPRSGRASVTRPQFRAVLEMLKELGPTTGVRFLTVRLEPTIAPVRIPALATSELSKQATTPVSK